ncbi:DUF6468 domain-containing protein [Pararoseomonas indoligenes]|uniref:DUF6468 domain-containing protein n=1 Tax=Roseomonas indoligenes TaxID=2820811 RepID=A0A940MWW3_9PROT|nr:DUF6468 domain-containing protein [Pararoseomonas indoligenes]MBP0492495.1 hypothetical protein [Pararoseomonas indoligenes]
MTALEWCVQGTLLLLLLAALPFILRLERGLSALCQDRAAMAEGTRGFELAAREAGSTLSGLRVALETGARQSASAESLRDDLRFLVERAESLADRLDTLIRQGRPPAVPAHAPIPAAEEAAPRSQAERDLLRALRMAR